MRQDRFTRVRLAVVAALLAGVASPALAVDVAFSFATDRTDPAVTNGVDGFVWGRIIGLTDNATSAATALFIDGFSTGSFTGVPVDATTWNLQVLNSFTMVGGVITAGSFYADNSNGVFDRLFINVPIGWPRGNTNYASVGVENVESVWNNTGLGGINFGGTVPEPASWAMMITGLGLAGAALRRRRSLAIA